MNSGVYSPKSKHFHKTKSELFSLIFYSLIRMSEQVIKVTTSIKITYSDLENRMSKRDANAIWDFFVSISKKRHVRYTVSAAQYDFVRDVIIDACIEEAPKSTSDSDSTFSG